MLTRGSRYEGVAPFLPTKEGTAFSGLRPRPIPETPGVVEHVISAGERLDLIARHYYDQDRAWWRILDANPWLLRELKLTGETKAEVFAPHLRLTELEGRTILIPKLEK